MVYPKITWKEKTTIFFLCVPAGLTEDEKAGIKLLPFIYGNMCFIISRQFKACCAQTVILVQKLDNIKAKKKN